MGIRYNGVGWIVWLRMCITGALVSTIIGPSVCARLGKVAVQCRNC
jgi:hypothetical protein